MPPNPQDQAQSDYATAKKTTHPLLICEALGFSPQLLLDDIINTSNNAVQDGVNGMEEFLQKWADERLARTQTLAGRDATMHEVEQGLVAFQTLLEYHTDIAFDFFEAWCLRNIFMIPPDLSIVLPHQEGLDLTSTVEKEQELLDEVEQLRKRLDGQRKLNRLLSRSLRTASRQLERAETRLSSLTALSGPDGSMLDNLHTLPSKYLAMYQTLLSLPPIEPSFASVDFTEPGKRQWETNKSGYINWAVGRLLVKGEAGGPMGQSAVDQVERSASAIGSGEGLRHALHAFGAVRDGLDALAGRQHTIDRDDQAADGGEEDSRMEE